MAAEGDHEVLLAIAEGVAEIRFNRPEVLNAVNVPLARAFRDAVAAAVDDAAVRVIVLAGAGKAFMAGGDLAYFRKAGTEAPAAAVQLIDPIHEAIERLQRARQPVLASLHGAVAGAGMSVALAADLAIASDDAVFNLAYAKVAATPDCGASWNLPRLVGLRKAMEIALMAENIPAPEALRLGLVNWMVPGEELAARTAMIAAKLASSAPLSMQGIKRLMRRGGEMPLDDQLYSEKISFARLAGSSDFREALDAFFEKRPPKFTGS